MAEYITVDAILAACQGRLDRDGGGMCRCPAHNDRKPSLSVREGDQGQPIILQCFAGCAFEDIRAELQRMIGLPWPPRSVALPRPKRLPREPQDAHDQIIGQLAELGALRPIKGTLAESYLQGRGIGCYANSRAFRFMPGSGRRHPALVSLIGNARMGFLQSYQSTFLCKNPKNGHVGKAPEPARLLAKGFSAKGGVIPLDGFDDPEEIVIAEGMETAASAGILFGLPAWAAISANNLPTLNLPPYIRRVLIAADNDKNETGQKAADSARKQWEAAGIATEVYLPEEPDTDFNDVLLAQKEKSRYA